MASDLAVQQSEQSKEPSSSSASAVSNAMISAASTANGTSQQTRFSFYEPQEIKAEIEPPSANRFTFYNTTEIRSEQRMAATRQPRPAGPNPSNSSSAGGARKDVPAATIPEDLPSTRSADSTDEILRSLQETEEQRMQLLGLGMETTTSSGNNNLKSMSKGRSSSTNKSSSTTTPLPSSKPSTKRTMVTTPQGGPPATTHNTMARPPQSVAAAVVAAASSSSTSALHNIDTVEDGSKNASSSGSNPYEDAIREALDLLRRHRSPPESPAFPLPPGGTRVPPPDHVGVQPVLSTNLSPNSRQFRPRTPREEDRVLQSRHDDEDDDEDKGDEFDIYDDVNVPPPMHETTKMVESIMNGEGPTPSATDPYEEAKLKAKQRQERMAKYASRLQEFKSSLPADAWIQPSTSATSPTQNSITYSERNVGNSPLKQVGTTDESAALSDLSQ